MDHFYDLINRLGFFGLLAFAFTVWLVLAGVLRLLVTGIQKACKR